MTNETFNKLSNAASETHLISLLQANALHLLTNRRHITVVDSEGVVWYCSPSTLKVCTFRVFRAGKPDIAQFTHPVSVVKGEYGYECLTAEGNRLFEALSQSEADTWAEGHNNGIKWAARYSWASASPGL
jgi:hypothetical protein